MRGSVLSACLNFFATNPAAWTTNHPSAFLNVATPGCCVSAMVLGNMGEIRRQGTDASTQLHNVDKRRCF